jgi:hypothetical protein
MRFYRIFLTLFVLVAPVQMFADDAGDKAKQDADTVHQKQQQDANKIHQKQKQDAKAGDKEAPQTEHQAGEDVKESTR